MAESSQDGPAHEGAAWIQRALNAGDVDSVNVGVLSLAFNRRLQEDDLGDLERLTLEALAGATSAMLRGGNWQEPFKPLAEYQGGRSILPSDLTRDQIDLLAPLVPSIEQPELRARLADVAWTYGDRCAVDLLDAAADAYLESPLVSDSWHRGGDEGWQRGLDLLHRRGKDGRERLERATNAVEARVLAGVLEDRFFTVQLASFLRENARLSTERSAAIAEHLANLGRQALPDARLSRHFDREAAMWFSRADDMDAALAASERAAATYVTEADQRAAGEDGAALAQSLFLERAIAAYRALPRKYRVEHGIETLLPQLRERLRHSREDAVDAMMRFESEPIDLSAYVSDARRRVSGHSTVTGALRPFVTLAVPVDAAAARTSAEELVTGSISHIFGSETLTADGRKVASRGGSVTNGSPEAVWAEMVRAVILNGQITAQGRILPALDVLTFEHRVTRNALIELCEESPTVPSGHEHLWAAGLLLGFDREFGPAVAVLVPQIEQMIRVLLKARGVHTLFVDDAGVETEKSINALLELDESTEVFGPGLILEMQALLVEQAGPNQRHDVAHGLYSDAAGWTYDAVYMWWFCVRLALWPALQLLDNPESESSSAPSGDQVGDDEDADVPTE